MTDPARVAERLFLHWKLEHGHASSPCAGCQGSVRQLTDALTAQYQAGVEAERTQIEPVVMSCIRWMRYVARKLPKLSDDAYRTSQDGLNYSSQLKQAIRRLTERP